MMPAWLLGRQEPVEIPEKKNYVLANLRTVARMLLYFSRSRPGYEAKGLPCVRLFELVVMIICILLSNTVLFLEIMLVIVMLRLVFLPGMIIRETMAKLLKLMVVSLLVIMPSVLLHNDNLGIFLARTALVMLYTALFLATTPWNQFVEALEQLHFPGVMILTLDITIKYIGILGRYLEEILTSIKLRSFGNGSSRKTVGVILGQLYLTSGKRMTELYEAMVLRGYDGEHFKAKSFRFGVVDWLTVVEVLAVIIICGVIR